MHVYHLQNALPLHLMKILFLRVCGSSAWSPVEFLECSLLMLFAFHCAGKVYDLFMVLMNLVSSLSKSLLFSLRSPGNVLALLDCSLDALLQEYQRLDECHGG